MRITILCLPKGEPDGSTLLRIPGNAVISSHISTITFNEHLDNMKSETIAAPRLFVVCKPIEYSGFHYIGNPRTIISHRYFNILIADIPGTDPYRYSGPPEFQA